MSGNNSDHDRINRLLRSTGAEEGAAEKLRQAAGNDPAVAKALERLTDSDIAGIAAILSDKQALARIMSSPKAMNLLKKLKG